MCSYKYGRTENVSWDDRLDFDSRRKSSKYSIGDKVIALDEWCDYGIYHADIVCGHVSEFDGILVTVDYSNRNTFHQARFQARDVRKLRKGEQFVA